MKEPLRLYRLRESSIGVHVFHFPTDTDFLQKEIEPMVTMPHRHDHYCCFFVEKGNVNFTIDFNEVPIPESSILISYPGQIHQSVPGEIAEGWALAFDAKFVDENALMIIEQAFSDVVLVKLDEKQKRWFQGILSLLKDETAEEGRNNYHNKTLVNLLNGFFYKAATIFQQQENERAEEYSSRSREIVKKYRQLVQQHFLTNKKPAEYAAKLNITVSYLNDTVKKLTGFSATYFIQNEVIKEAQRQLFYTTKSVKEIGFELGYDDPKYFIRLFSKSVGVSPSSFRNTSDAHKSSDISYF